MKRLVGALLLCGALFLPRGPVQGQPSPQFGLTVGLNVTTLSSPTADLGTRQMFSGGVVMQMDVIGPLSIQPQLLLDQKGAVAESEDVAIRYGAGYIDLPLLLRLKGPTLGPVTPYALAGGFGGVKVFEQQRAGSSGPGLSTGTDISYFKRTNAGLAGGLGGTIAIGGDRRLNLAVRYSHGMMDVARNLDEQPLPVSLPPEARTRTWSIMLRLGV